MGAEFIDLKAATDIQGPGALITEDFSKEITDVVRRTSVLDGRIAYIPASGNFSTYYEQNTVNGGVFVDPRAVTAAATSNARTEHSAKVKAITNQVSFGHYDVTVGKQQNNFPELKAKDLNDMLNAIGLVHGKALWRGTDTSLTTPTTLQYVGIASQITNTFTVGATANIVAAICAKVAAMVASENYQLMPSAVYIHPIAHFYLTEEERMASNNTTQISALSKTSIAGLEVLTIMTAAGLIPIFPEPFMPSAVNGADGTLTDYGVAIVTEKMLEYHYMGEKGMFLFQMGTVTDLKESYVGIKYGVPIAKGASYAHAYGTISRPTVAAIG
jgi:hypothetical protein